MPASPHVARNPAHIPRESVLDRLWFDVGSAGRVLACGSAALEAGIDTGMDALTATRVLAAVAGSVTFEPVPDAGDERDGPWRCRGPRPASTHDAVVQMAELRARLHEEGKRRRQIERKLISVSEKEQRRISLELHDGLGQHLSGLAFTASSLADRLHARHDAESQEAAWLARLLRDAVGRIRAISRGLWPVSLERQSLAQALQALATDVEELYGITVNVEADEFLAESGEVAHHLFRIAQEGIHNALKHGKARRIDVRVESLPPRAMLSVVSDGAPLDEASLQGGRGLGVMGMRLRAESLGGELSLEPLASGGVELCLTWTPGRSAAENAANGHAAPGGKVAVTGDTEGRDA
jgi:signal transduction histidine kinase